MRDFPKIKIIHFCKLLLCKKKKRCFTRFDEDYGSLATHDAAAFTRKIIICFFNTC